MASWTDNLDFEALKDRIDALPHGQKRSYQEEFAGRLGISYSTLRRAMIKRFGREKQIEREAQVPEELIHRVAKLKETYSQTTLKGDGRELSTQACLEILQDQGYEEAGTWSGSAVNAGLRRLGYRVQDPKQRVEAQYAGQQFQIDFSRSKHFQIMDRTEDGDWLLKVSAKELHYKDGAVKLRTWVVQMRDEYSRLRLVRYYPATSESAILGAHFLRWCFNRPEDSHLMGDLPERLKGDQGAFMKSKIGRNVLDKLDIDRKLAMPGNSDSQGKVERGFRTLWQRFESVLATRLIERQGPDATLRLSKLCQLVHQFTIREHKMRHPVFTRRRRGEMYQQSILRHPLRQVDVDVLDLAARTWKRKADSTRMISIEGEPYEVPPFAAGHWVRVFRHPEGHMVGEMVDGYRKKPFKVAPYNFADLDDFSDRPRQTYAQEIRREVEEDQKKIQNLKSQRAEKVSPSSPFEEAAQPDEPEQLTLLEARAQLGRALRSMGLSDDEAAGQVQRFVDAGLLTGSMTRADVDDLIDRIRQPQRKAI